MLDVPLPTDARSGMPGSGIGASLPRLEDARLLTGGGCY